MTFLFIPVSSPNGIGEYQRSLIIANEIVTQWPNANIHFIISEQVSYAQSCPYNVHLTPSSPTNHTRQVNEVIKRISPDLTIFDASGRAQQVKCAKNLGSKVVFISQHRKKRARGLKLNRLFNLDLHWVAQPEFAIEALSPWERLKLSLFNRPAPQPIGPVFTPVNQSIKNELLESHQLTDGDFVLFNAGSGGHMIGDELATDIYAAAARELAAGTQQQCVVVFGSNYPTPLPAIPHVTCIKALNNDEFICLMDAAKLLVIGGGDSLLQAIAMGKHCISTPVSKDQPNRINRCSDLNLIYKSATHAQEMTNLATAYLEKSLNKLDNVSFDNGLITVMKDIKHLLTKD